MIVFPPIERPELSVLMVTYGRWDWISGALTALREHTPPVYEVVVVDNASPDDTADRLATEVFGIHLVRNETNAGFGGGTNLAAAEARGEILCLLNSDALVREGWYPPMRARLDDPTVGAVVPLFVGEDEKVLEAGAMVGADGVTAPFGRGCDPEGSDVRFPRDVDYGSAACMLVRSAAFSSAGGFSPAYGIGYYEDVELCLEMRAQGLRTVYEPGATVLHALGASGEPSEATELSRRNRVVFLRRRAADLEGRPKLDQTRRFPHRMIHGRDHLAPLRVLILADRLPAAGSPEHGIVVALADRAAEWRVTFVAGSPHARDEDRAQAESLLAKGFEVVLVPEAGWLKTRTAHATIVVILGPLAAARHGQEVVETQPQAALIYDMSGPEGPDHTADRAAEIDMLHRAEVVLAPTAAHARFAEEFVSLPRTIAVHAAGLDVDRMLSEAFAISGVERRTSGSAISPD